MEETISLSRLADMIIVYCFVGLIATFAGAEFGKFVLWVGDRIRRAFEKHDSEE